MVANVPHQNSDSAILFDPGRSIDIIFNFLLCDSDSLYISNGAIKIKK